MLETLSLPEGCRGSLWRHVTQGSIRRPHRHAELEFNLIVEGVSEYIVQDRRYTLRRGSLLWLFPEQEHLLLRESRNHVMWIGVFAPALVRQLCTTEATTTLTHGDPVGAWHRVLSEPVTARLETLCDELKPMEGRDVDCYNAGLGYALLAAWREYHRTDGGEAGASLHPGVEKAIRLLRNETDEGPPLSMLARQAGLSASRLCELFQAQTGMTLIAFRNRQRVERFLRLYGDGRSFTALQAALEAGFGSYPQFSRVFQQVTGHSPSNYRRRVRD